MRVFHAVANTSPSSKVENGIKWSLFLKQTFKRLLLFDVESVEAKIFRLFVLLELSKSPILESNIIIIVEVVDSDHLMPMVEQFSGYLRGNEASGAGNEVSFTQA